MTAQAPEHPHGAHEVSPRARRIATVLIVTFVLLAAAVVVGTTLRKRRVANVERARLETERDKGVRVTVARVETTPTNRTLRLPGDVRGYSQSTVYAKISGYVRDVRVERGQHVHRGDVLATIESPETERDVSEARNSSELAKINADRYMRLAPSGVVSSQDRDNAVTQARVSSAALARSEDLLAYSIVRAPFDGIVSARYVDPGALVPAATGSTQSALPIVDIADVSTVRIFVYVGQDSAPFVHTGDEAVVWQDELPSRRIVTKVTHATGALDPRTRAMQVEIDVSNQEWGLLPGTFTHVELKVPEPPTPLIPDAAIVVRDGKTKVAAIEGGKAHFIDVDLGYNDGARVRVLRGLHGGETVGTSVPVEVEEGSPVQATPMKPEGPDGGA